MAEVTENNFEVQFSRFFAAAKISVLYWKKLKFSPRKTKSDLK